MVKEKRGKGKSKHKCSPNMFAGNGVKMKRTAKKTAAVMLTAAAVLVTSVAVPKPENVAAATKKVTITNVSNGALTIKKGSTYQLKAKVGSNSKLNFTWKSSNAKKVSVNKNGKIKGLKKGTATITVSVKGKNYKKAKVKVTVTTKTTVSQIQVLRPAMVVPAGNTATIVSKVLPTNASNKKVKYTSSNKKVASVDSKGVVKGIGEGTAKITIKAADGSNKKTVVTVKVLKDASEVKLMDDFYQSANADILNNTELDEKAGSWSQFSILEEKIEDRVDEIIDALSKEVNQEGTIEDNLSDFYKTSIDTKTRDDQKLKTIQGYLDEINQVTNIDEYVVLQGKLSKEGIDGIFSTFVYNDLKDTANYQVYFYEINTGLSETEFSSIMYNKVKTEYVKYVKKLLELSGETAEQAAANASDIIAFQRNVATTNKSILDSYNIDNIYHKYTVEDLEKAFTNCNIRSYLQEAGYGNVESFIVYNEEQLVRVNKYLKSSNLDMLKEYAKLNVLFQYAPYLTTEFFEAYETFDTVKNMEKEKETVEEFSKRTVQEGMTWDVSKLYVEKYVTADTKKNVETMVDTLIKKYNEQINACSWMTKATKKEALKKLDKITKNISYPDDWSSYTTKVQFKGIDEGGILSDNVQMLYKEIEEDERSLIGTTTGKEEWIMPPLDVNAYYMPSFNSITIPIGITEGAFYDANRSEAENLGLLGVVIGHEISHAFDAEGSKYDENGEERDWWTASDKKKYEAILQKLEDYYDTFELLPGVFQDGETTLSENIADLAGASCAVKLVGNSKEERMKFFESYANVWAGEMTEDEIKANLLLDVHANQKVRVNAVVSLMDEFYETYDIKSTDAMYVAPANRIKIW